MLRRIYITGDKHGNFFNRQFNLSNFCSFKKSNLNDVLIVLGDAGINYSVNDTTEKGKYQNSLETLALKAEISKMPITLFCIHGNHEARPESILTYKEKIWNGGIVYYEAAYPSILFAKDGEEYDLNGYKILVLGGAYSIDKKWRLINYNAGYTNYKWFADEQMSEKIKDKIRKNSFGKAYNFILTHTCPKKYEPTEVFLTGVDQVRQIRKQKNFWTNVRRILDIINGFADIIILRKL